ncbi:helix-turn-helix transcriptional regulator [Hyphomonas sp.]|uniref:helix-turn-helix domain-containing protein n=1 Tax=Hyphomonas sp. TaxID=87 RepID=UPI0023568623|nr:helix-turn-helix transcriptional regulator [Hyphomonas sp.]|tara:strand:- start:561 stop:1115 length:555 start_codon:yes stop_codon:yes gene_type:complete
MAKQTTSAAQAQGHPKQGAGTAAPAAAGNSREQIKNAPSNSKTSRAPNAIDLQVGENLRRFRLDRNLTLAELGETLGISHQQLQKYETGSNRISAGMLKQAADALRVSVLDFFDDAATQEDIADSRFLIAGDLFRQMEDLVKVGTRLTGPRRRASQPEDCNLPRNLQDPPIPAKAIPAGTEAHA